METWEYLEVVRSDKGEPSRYKGNGLIWYRDGAYKEGRVYLVVTTDQ